MSRKFLILVLFVLTLTVGVFLYIKNTNAVWQCNAIEPKCQPGDFGSRVYCTGVTGSGGLYDCPVCDGIPSCDPNIGSYTCNPEVPPNVPPLGNIFCAGQQNCKCDPIEKCISTPNACGQVGDGIVVDGVCNAVTPPNPPRYGTVCTATSSPNACGATATNTGTIQCDSNCSAVTPAPPPNPVNYGNTCTATSNPNACGQSNTVTGTIQCNRVCSAYNSLTEPPNPPGYGTACTSLANACGQTNSGTIQCNTECSATPPPDSNCAGPTVTISANPNPVAYNTAATVSWSSANATSCSISPGGWTGTSGARSTGNLITNTNYTASCTGPGGNGSANVTVIVSAAPTLTVSSFSANPPSGNAPLSSYLSVAVGGTVTGTINYTFWWNCPPSSYSGANVAAAITACGNPDGVAGNGVGNKFDGVSATSQNSVSHTFTSGTFTPLVIVERGGLAARATTAVTVSNAPPTISAVTVSEPDYCYAARQARISWTYSDPTGDPQSSYQVQLGIDDNFSPPALDFTSGPSSDNLYNAANLAFNTNYVGRVRVWDSQGGVSNWQNQTLCNGPGCAGNRRSWTTPRHYYPSYAQFTWNPFIIHAKEPIQFFNQSTCYNDSNSPTSCRRWEYDFDYNTGIDSTNNPNPVYTYITPGDYAITERVVDNEGYACPSSLIPVLVNVTRSIPVWKEVSPAQ